MPEDKRFFLEPAVLGRLMALPLHARQAMLGSVSGKHRSPVRGSSLGVLAMVADLSKGMHETSELSALKGTVGSSFAAIFSMLALSGASASSLRVVTAFKANLSSKLA